MWKIRWRLEASWFGQHDRRLCGLLFERSNNLVFVQTECVRVLPEKAAGKKATGKAIKPILFHGLKVMGANLRLSADLRQLQTAAQTLPPQGIANRIHNELPGLNTAIR
jgi:hypothetical protein